MPSQFFERRRIIYSYFFFRIIYIPLELSERFTIELNLKKINSNVFNCSSVFDSRRKLLKSRLFWQLYYRLKDFFYTKTLIIFIYSELVINIFKLIYKRTVDYEYTNDSQTYNFLAFTYNIGQIYGL